MIAEHEDQAHEHVMRLGFFDSAKQKTAGAVPSDLCSA